MITQKKASRSGVANSGSSHSFLREKLHSVIPSHFRDPFGLAKRILESRNQDAYSAAYFAGLRLGLTPLDLWLGCSRGLVDSPPVRPLLFVVGPPRSGTTLLHQLLIKSLPVAYITNLASLLPRASIAGTFPLVRGIANERVQLHSYYGRTRSLHGPSDGLEFWDRFLGPDRRRIPQRIDPDAAIKMLGFFGRLELQSDRPVVAKNNSLLGSAHLVAKILPTAHFVCMRRDPLYLGQSLLSARRDIHGDTDVGYGIDQEGASLEDPVEDVWRQIRFYRQLEQTQTRNLGAKFLVIDYEDLCANPHSVVEGLAKDVLEMHQPISPLEPLVVSRKRRIDQAEFTRLESLIKG